MFKIIADLGNLMNQPKLLQEVRKFADEQAKGMAFAAHAEAIRLANERLHSRRDMYVENLHLDTSGECPVLVLNAKARWIDDGMPAHDQLDALLKSPKAKRSKKGDMYVVVPFKAGPKGPTQMTPAQSSLLDTIKTELKARKLPYSKLETGEGGQPKTGVLHRFDIDGPTKTADGPGQGKGPIGSPRQGITGTPFGHGIQISQRALEKPNGGMKIVREIMTFRIASSAHKGQRWQMPELPPVGIMELVERFANDQWTNVIGPAIADRIAGLL